MSFALTTKPPSLFRPALGRGSSQTASAAPIPMTRTPSVARAERDGPETTLPEQALTGSSSAADSVLAQKAASGDVQAFGLLVERYQKPMTALVARMTTGASGTPSADVDDIVQELFIRAWKGLPRFRHDAQFSTWLYRIAVNTTIKHRSRHKTEAALSVSADNFAGGLDALPTVADAQPPGGGDPFVTASRRERDTLLRSAVSQLPEKQRTVVVLHYFEGFSCEEISQIVGCSLGTVWSRLHYACKRLKGVMEPTEALA